MLKTNLSISQNFFKDVVYVKQLVEKSNIQVDDTVIDIGSGSGIIADALLEKGVKVISIEKDPSLYQKLLKKYSSNKRVNIINTDFIDYKLPDLRYKIFSNIPFNRSADILNKILILPNKLDSAFIVLQDKTAERYIGLPNYGSTQISVIHKPFFDMKVISSIPSRMFIPKPKVNIVLMEIKRKDSFDIDIKDYKLYRDFIVYLFNQRNSEISETLKNIFTKLQIKRISNNFDIQNKRPSEIDIAQWLGLFNTFLTYGKDRLHVVKGYESKYNRSHLNRTKRNRTNI